MGWSRRGGCKQREAEGRGQAARLSFPIKTCAEPVASHKGVWPDECGRGSSKVNA